VSVFTPSDGRAWPLSPRTTPPAHMSATPATTTTNDSRRDMIDLLDVT
jgi:hypothetical protein